MLMPWDNVFLEQNDERTSSPVSPDVASGVASGVESDVESVVETLNLKVDLAGLYTCRKPQQQGDTSYLYPQHSQYSFIPFPLKSFNPFTSLSNYKLHLLSLLLPLPLLLEFLSAIS